jgi:excisionase family DNA binding protein
MRKKRRAIALARMTLTIPEAARLLGISRNAAYQAARSGQIPTLRIGRLLLVPKVAFDAMLAGGGTNKAS